MEEGEREGGKGLHAKGAEDAEEKAKPQPKAGGRRWPIGKLKRMGEDVFAAPCTAGQRVLLNFILAVYPLSSVADWNWSQPRDFT